VRGKALSIFLSLRTLGVCDYEMVYLYREGVREGASHVHRAIYERMDFIAFDFIASGGVYGRSVAGHITQTLC
jgi:hypothetical protein